MRRQKTTSEIYQQHNRIYSLMYQNASNQIKQADPDTGGNHMLTHNWGNDKARKFLQQFQDRTIKLNAIYTPLYQKAFAHEYPEHNNSKRYFAEIARSKQRQQQQKQTTIF